MILPLPILARDRRAAPPWITASVVAAIALVFALTWPSEKHYGDARRPGTALNAAARALVDTTETPSFSIASAARSALAREARRRFFPTTAADGLFRALDGVRARWPKPVRRDWDAAYARYIDVKREMTEMRVPSASIADRFGFDPSRRLLSPLFFHVFFHDSRLLVVLIVLFLVAGGPALEDAWGPQRFGAFLAGAALLPGLAVAALSATGFGPLLGAGGPAAAVWGALLVRHRRAPLTWKAAETTNGGPRPALLSGPAWPVVAALVGSLPALGAAAGRAGPSLLATMMGLAFGAAVAIVGERFARLLPADGADSETAPTVGPPPTGPDRAPAARLARAERLLEEGRPRAALKLYETLAADNAGFSALAGALDLSERLGKTEALGRLAVRAIAAAVAEERFAEGSALFDRWKARLEDAALEDRDLVSLGQALIGLGRFEEAARLFAAFAQTRRLSPHRGKAIFTVGKLCRDKLGQPRAAEVWFRALLKPPFAAEWGGLARTELRALGAPAIRRPAPPARR